MVDALEDTQVQADDTQLDDDQLQETEVGATSNLNTSDTAAPCPASTDVTDASGKMATTSQGQKKDIDGTNKVSNRKRKKTIQLKCLWLSQLQVDHAHLHYSGAKHH